MSAIRRKLGFGKPRSEITSHYQDENSPPRESMSEYPQPRTSSSQQQHPKSTSQRVQPDAPRLSHHSSRRSHHGIPSRRHGSQRSHRSGRQPSQQHSPDIPEHGAEQPQEPVPDADAQYGSTSTAKVKKAIGMFCSASDDSDVVHLPIIVETVTASSAAAKVAAEQITKFIKANLINANHNAIVLLGTLSSHPGQKFTKHIDGTSLTASLRTLLKTSGDHRVQTRAQQTLESMLPSHDIYLYELRKMWLKERHEIDKAAARNPPGSAYLRMTPSQIFELGQQSVLGQGNIQIKTPSVPVYGRPSHDVNRHHLPQPPLPPPPPLPQQWTPTPDAIAREIHGADAAAEMMTDMYSNTPSDPGLTVDGQPDGLEDLARSLVEQCTLAIQRLTPLLNCHPPLGVDPQVHRSQMTEVVCVIDKIGQALSLRNQALLHKLLGDARNTSSSHRLSSRDNGESSSARPSMAISRGHSPDGGSTFGSGAIAGPSQPTAGHVQLQQEIENAIHQADMHEGQNQGQSVSLASTRATGKGKERMEPVGDELGMSKLSLSPPGASVSSKGKELAGPEEGGVAINGFLPSHSPLVRPPHSQPPPPPTASS